MTNPARIRILSVDDHPLFRGALSQALQACFADAEILEAGSLEGLTDELERAADIDLVLLDLAMPGVHGISGLLYLRAQHPEAARGRFKNFRRVIRNVAAGTIAATAARD